MAMSGFLIRRRMLTKMTPRSCLQQHSCKVLVVVVEVVRVVVVLEVVVALAVIFPRFLE